MIYVSLAIADTMFPYGEFLKEEISPELAKNIVSTTDVVSALNPSHKSTIDILERKFGLTLPIPEKAPKVSLQSGDQLIVFQADLPRLAQGEVHSQEVVENAVIKFSLWTIM
jgi:Domain of unknown function (DUF1874)